MTLEFLLVFPILVIAAFATIEFGILLLVQQAVTSASIEGARKAAQIGADADDVGQVVQDFLGTHEILFNTTAAGSGAAFGDARVIIEFGPVDIDDRLAQSLQTYERGNTDIPHVPIGAPPGLNQVRVTVCTWVTDLAGVRPVPDWLVTFGFSIDGRVFQLRSLANLE